MIVKYFSWVKDIVGVSEEKIIISSDINTPEKLIDFLIKKDNRYKKAFYKNASIKQFYKKPLGPKYVFQRPWGFKWVSGVLWAASQQCKELHRK